MTIERFCWAFFSTLCVLMLSVWLCGCAHLPAYYKIEMSPDFTPDQIDAITKAAGEWQAQVPVSFTFEMGRCFGFPQDTICLQPATHAEICANDPYELPPGAKPGACALGYTELVGTGSIIYLDSSLGEKALQDLTAHELGHAMGLGHSTNPRDVMWPYIVGNVVGPGDIKAWYAVR